MTALARYVGPLAAFRGAIGRAMADGVEIAGRLRRGTSVAPDYILQPCGVPFRSWRDAVDALSDWLSSRDAGAAEWVRGQVETVDGLEVAIDGIIYAIRIE